MNIAPYKPRCTVMNGVREIADWKLKIYTIHESQPELEPEIVEAAIEYATLHVNWPESREGYGFLIIHFGNEAVWLLVDLWVDDILRHFLFRAPVSEPTQFGEAPKDGTMACVWELAVFVHERESWVKHAMSRPKNPDYEAYVRDGVEIVP